MLTVDLRDQWVVNVMLKLEVHVTRGMAMTLKLTVEFSYRTIIGNGIGTGTMALNQNSPLLSLLRTARPSG
jgi:hypothetical protein